MIGNEDFSSAAAAAKLLQSCLTLCDPIDGSPPGSPIPGILQARTLEWVAISFSNAGKWKVKVKSLNRVRLLATPWTAAYQAPPSMGFSRQEYWSGVRKHLTRDFLCAVLDLSGTLWPLLIIPEYSGNKRRGTPFPGLRNPGISHYGDKYPLPFYEPYGKRWLFATLSDRDRLMFCKSGILIFIFAENNHLVKQYIFTHHVDLNTFAPSELGSPCLSLSLWLIPWSAEARWAHFLARASKTLSRRHTVPSSTREGAWCLCAAVRALRTGLLAFRVN